MCVCVFLYVFYVCVCIHLYVLSPVTFLVPILYADPPNRLDTGHVVAYSVHLIACILYGTALGSIYCSIYLLLHTWVFHYFILKFGPPHPSEADPTLTRLTPP